jgi:hypothetical protein
LALISVGLLSLLFAAVQRRRDIKAMKALYPDAKGVSMATTVGCSWRVWAYLRSGC